MSNTHPNDCLFSIGATSHNHISEEVKLLTCVRLFVAPVDCNLPSSSIHGIFQARLLEWVAISYSRGSSQPRDQTWVSRTADRLYHLTHQGSRSKMRPSTERDDQVVDLLLTFIDYRWSQFSIVFLKTPLREDPEVSLTLIHLIPWVAISLLCLLPRAVDY